MSTTMIPATEAADRKQMAGSFADPAPIV